MKLIGHRGAPREFPANTMLSFERAFALGCDMVECDIRLSSDGVVVLAHDPHVIDRTGKQSEIDKTSCGQLAALDLGAGQGVPSLETLVKWAAGKCGVMADMKCEGAAVESQVVGLLRPLSDGMCIIPGAGYESRQRLRTADPSLHLSLSLDAPDGEALIERFGFDRMLDLVETPAVTWQYPLLTAERVAAINERGIAVFAWTVDDMNIARKLIEDGVAGIISNRADLLVDFARKCA